ncbi:hypothetical protein AMR41_00035 [Hapalosiphon sp. MRB220]|nr:hypothetical protein AMR41_00035 [Hapalosiphon sp. MRB220]
MPKSKLESRLKNSPQAEATATEDMPKKFDPVVPSKPQTKVELLDEQINQTQQKISVLKTEITALENQLGESREAIALIENPIKWEIADGQFDLFQQMREVLSHSKSEEDRIETLEGLKLALQRGHLMLESKRSQLSQHENELRRLTEEKDWFVNYEPHVIRFGDSYTTPKNQLIKIKNAEQHLRFAQGQLKEYEDLNQDPETAYQWERKNPRHDLLSELVPRWRGFVEKAKKDLQEAKNVDEPDFRRYIRARVDADESLQALMKAQSSYLAAVEQFTQHASKLDIQMQCTLPLVNVDDNGGIVVTTKKL